MSYYGGLKYKRLKKEKGGYKAYLAKGQSGPLTSEVLAKECKVSESTIKRDSKYARGLDYIGSMNLTVKKKILNGDSRIKKSDINLLGNPDNQIKIRKILEVLNEGDLQKKIERIRKDILNETENKLNVNKTNVENAREILADKELMFLDPEDRIKKNKGMILSNLNKAIKNKDVDSLDEIRKLVDRLQDILD